MRVLFVSSGNSENFKISPFIKAQADSLEKLGVEIDFFTIQGKGILGYLKNVQRLKKYLKKSPVDLIHAHYTLSGWIAVMAHPGVPIVLSIMGSDAYGEYLGPKKVKLTSRYLTLLTYLIQPFVSAIISKSRNIDAFVYRRNIAHIIPNGVMMENFGEMNKDECRRQLGLRKERQYVLFLGNKNNIRKNYALVDQAVRIISDENIELIAPFPISSKKIVKFLNATDVFVLCSFMEGSPNVIKEAMACNCPIVATDVGDVRWVIGDTKGCFIASFDPVDFAEKLRRALEFAQSVGRTSGRERIIDLGLDAESVARRIVNVYKQVLAKPGRPKKAFK